MSSISQCKYDIERYRTLKNNVNSIIYQLSISIGNVDHCTNEIRNKYIVNDNYTPIEARSSQLKINMESTYNFLNNQVIPAIDTAITNLNKEIASLEEDLVK